MVNKSNTPIAVNGDEVKAETDFLFGNGIIRYPSTFENGHYLWGSSHPGTLNMAIADGSVQSTSVTIDPAVFNNKWRLITGAFSPL